MAFLSSFSNRFRTALLGTGVLLFLGAVQSPAALITDPAGDFIPSYTGPKNGDLDVLSAQVLYDGSNFTFTSTLNGNIGITPAGLYVWGIDRGTGTVGFPAIAPGVTFDAIFAITPSGVSSVRDLVTSVSTTITNITVSGATVTGIVPASLLPSRGLTPLNYTVNLWPRSGAGGQEVISDFAPNNSNALVTNATPEPATISLVGGVVLVGIAALRRRQKLQ